MVNWDPKFQTALFDLEAENHDEKGSLWHFRYHFTDTNITTQDGKNYLVVATTRPETLFGDTAVAVNPVIERYVPDWQNHHFTNYRVVSFLSLPMTMLISTLERATVSKSPQPMTVNDYELRSYHDLRRLICWMLMLILCRKWKCIQDLVETRELTLGNVVPSDYAGLERLLRRGN